MILTPDLIRAYACPYSLKFSETLRFGLKISKQPKINSLKFNLVKQSVDIRVYLTCDA